MISEDSRFLISEDSRFLISEDGRFLISEDSRFPISEDSRFLISEDSRCLISQDNTCHAGRERRKVVILGMNGVAMDRHGPILSQNEATDSRKVSGYLLDLRDALKNSKMARTTENPKTAFFPYILIYKLPIYRPWRPDMLH